MHSVAMSTVLSYYSFLLYFDRDDEHHLIAQYCQSLNGDTSNQAVSTTKILIKVVELLNCGVKSPANKFWFNKILFSEH